MDSIYLGTTRRVNKRRYSSSDPENLVVQSYPAKRECHNLPRFSVFSNSSPSLDSDAESSSSGSSTTLIGDDRKHMLSFSGSETSSVNGSSNERSLPLSNDTRLRSDRDDHSSEEERSLIFTNPSDLSRESNPSSDSSSLTLSDSSSDVDSGSDRESDSDSAPGLNSSSDSGSDSCSDLQSTSHYDSDDHEKGDEVNDEGKEHKRKTKSISQPPYQRKGTSALIRHRHSPKQPHKNDSRHDEDDDNDGSSIDDLESNIVSSDSEDDTSLSESASCESAPVTPHPSLPSTFTKASMGSKFSPRPSWGKLVRSVGNPSSLKSRLDALLPKLKADNEELEVMRLGLKGILGVMRLKEILGERDTETLLKGQETHVEMELGLGVPDEISRGEEEEEKEGDEEHSGNGDKGSVEGQQGSPSLLPSDAKREKVGIEVIRDEH